MNDQTPDLFPLSTEQCTALTEQQKQIFAQLDEKDRQFFAKNFSPTSLGKALERKWETIQSNLRLATFDKKLKENLAAQASQPTEQPNLSAGDIAIGAAGLAGAVGVGVFARKIAPEGKATWNGVTPRDLVNPLLEAFARKEKTDIRFQAPTEEGTQQATIMLRTEKGPIPALTIVLAPLDKATQVQISKVTSESLIETAKNSGQKLIDLVQDGLSASRQGGIDSLLDLAGKVLNQGGDLIKNVQDVNLEDKAWEVIQQTAGPLQAIYDEKMAAEKERILKLEIAWGDYNACPKCRVEFGAEDTECRVCGAARPERPAEPDPQGI